MVEVKDSKTEESSNITVGYCNYALKSLRFWLSLMLLQSSKPTGRPYVAAMIFFQHLVAMKIPLSTCSYENLLIKLKPNQKVDVFRCNREFVVTVIVIIEFDCISEFKTYT